MSDQDLAYHLQMKFGLSYNEPNSYQLLAIKADISQLVSRGRTEPYRVCRRPSFLRECPDEKSKIYP